MTGPHGPVCRQVLGVTLAILVVAVFAGCREAAPGRMRIDGSSTVFPISEAAAEEFSKISRARINVAFSGTGGGIEKFCRSEVEIANASRPIKQDELQRCAANSIADVVEIQVAIDALTVVVHTDNDWVDCLSVEELFAIFSEGRARRWVELRPGWPDREIVLYYPGTDSGTFDYFNEAVVEGTDKDATHRGDGTASEDDNVLALGVENDRYSIGYFGFAYYQESGRGLRAVPIDGGDGCVAPSIEGAASGEYQPLSRPLFIYTRRKLLADETVHAFLAFYLDHAQELAAEVGYIPLSEEVLQEQRARLAP